MAFITGYRRAGCACAAIAITAALVWFGTGLEPWWPLMWFAPLPVLLFATRATWPGAALAAFAGWLLGNLNLWTYYHDVVLMPVGVVLSIVAGAAAGFAVAVLLYRLLLRRGAYWSAVLAFPALWVSAEYLVNLASVHGTAANLAYTQLNFLPFLQLASITGPWGMSFLLLLFPAATATGLYLRRRAPGPALRIAGVSLGAIAAVLVFGAVRLAWPVGGPIVTVGLAASDLEANVNTADAGVPAARLLKDYAAQASALATRGAQVVVLPEKVARVAESDAADTDALFQSVADRSGAVVVIGVVYAAASAKYNRALVYTPRAPRRDYDKHHLLPPFESDLTPGTAPIVLPRQGSIWGVAICKDMDFTPFARQYGKKGVGLMLVPAWDFSVDRIFHGNMAIMRGVESGFAVARSAKESNLVLTDNRGRVVAQTRSDSAPFATVLAQVPVAHSATLYLALGDWFAWVALALFAFTLVQALRLRNMPWKVSNTGSASTPLIR